MLRQGGFFGDNHAMVRKGSLMSANRQEEGVPPWLAELKPSWEFHLGFAGVRRRAQKGRKWVKRKENAIRIQRTWFLWNMNLLRFFSCLKTKWMNWTTFKHNHNTCHLVYQTPCIYTTTTTNSFTTTHPSVHFIPFLNFEWKNLRGKRPSPLALLLLDEVPLTPPIFSLLL